MKLERFLYFHYTRIPCGVNEENNNLRQLTFMGILLHTIIRVIKIDY